MSTPTTEFKPGLEGVVAAHTKISEIDGEHGTLIYQGYSISELAETCIFEEIVYLLWNGHLPTQSELDALKIKMANERELPEEVSRSLRLLPVIATPMDALRTGISAYGTVANIQGKPTEEQSLALLSRFPTILAYFNRHRNNQLPIHPRKDLSHAANYLYMLTGMEPNPSHVRSLDSYLILLADHNMNASTFTARVIASTESDLCSAITGAIGALKGPLHGGAPSLVLKMLQSIGQPDRAVAWINNELDNKGRIMGIGHRVYKTYDPRAEILREMARRCSTPEFFSLAYETEQAALAELQRRKPNERLWTNVEFYSAAVLYAVGLTGDLFTPTFAVARIAGWSAHVLEQMQKNRLMRPDAVYTGIRGLKFVPIEARVEVGTEE
jgi:citrate synthase